MTHASRGKSPKEAPKNTRIILVVACPGWMEKVQPCSLGRVRGWGGVRWGVLSRVRARVSVCVLVEKDMPDNIRRTSQFPSSL